MSSIRGTSSPTDGGRSCPRFPVWEDARAEGLVRQTGGGENRVELTEHGRRALARALTLAPGPQVG